MLQCHASLHVALSQSRDELDRVRPMSLFLLANSELRVFGFIDRQRIFYALNCFRRDRRHALTGCGKIPSCLKGTAGSPRL
jgi:hypothetical protein